MPFCYGSAFHSVCLFVLLSDFLFRIYLKLTCLLHTVNINKSVWVGTLNFLLRWFRMTLNCLSSSMCQKIGKAEITNKK